MCGICGFINNGYDNKCLYNMNQQISHRGPDDEGYYIDDSVGLAQKRLSIIDLSTSGKQPMSDNKGDIIVSFNGEIYNYKEIRSELKSKGYIFNSNTDTEVIIYAYKCWGTECLSKFNGMFAIALWDHQSKTLILARDRIGIKPLYYYKKDNEFIFGSELKPIIKHPRFNKKINKEAVNLYLTFGYIPCPHTIYSETYKLEAGKYLIYKNGQVQINTYWDVLQVKNKVSFERHINENNYVDELDRLLTSSVRMRLVGDVPVGAFLSGGIDSSLIVALMQKETKEKVKTFSIGFENQEFNEANYAKDIASYLGTDHTELYIKDDQLLSLVEDMVKYYDEPFYDSSSIPTMLVSKLAKEKVTVSLSGDGGDELFCGYKTYSHIKKLSYLHILPKFIKKGIGILGRLYNKDISRVLDYTGDISNLVINLKCIFSEKERNAILLECVDFDRGIEHFRSYSEIKKKDILDIEMISDIKSYMVDDILTKVDRASMKYSLEARVPLLDHRVVEFSMRTPLSLKVKKNEMKYLLKQVLYRYLPKSYTNRPKKGFSVPIEQWVRGPLKSDIDRVFDYDFIDKQKIFNPQVLRDEYENSRLTSKQIWSIYIFQLWYERYCL